MASSAADAPSMRPWPRQILGGVVAGRGGLERWLEAERDQIVLWLPVAFGAGIAAWFVLPDAAAWIPALLSCAAGALIALAAGQGGRASRGLAVGLVAAALGLGLVWWRAERVAGVVLARPMIVAFEARVLRIEPLAARDLVRLRLATGTVMDPATDRGGLPTVLPAIVRVNLAEKDVPAGLTRGATIALRARLMPPPEPGAGRL